MGGGPAAGPDARAMTVRTSVYDPLLGLTWQELGSVARAEHRSQGASQLMASPVEGEASFVLLDSVPAVTEREGDVLDGLDLTFAGLLRFAPDHERTAPFLRAELYELQARVDAARAAFDPAAPEKTLPSLQAALQGVQALSQKVATSGLDKTAREVLADRLQDEDRDLEAALRLAHGLDLEVVADDDVVIPGQSFFVTARVANLGTVPISVQGVSLVTTPGWSFKILEGRLRELARGESALYRYQVWVPAGSAPSQPYWRRPRGAERQYAAVALRRADARHHEPQALA